MRVACSCLHYCSTNYLCTLSTFFIFNDTATAAIYTLSLHDALPISRDVRLHGKNVLQVHLYGIGAVLPELKSGAGRGRSEVHTSELQSQSNLVCRLLLEKKKNNQILSSISTHTSTLTSNLWPSSLSI